MLSTRAARGSTFDRRVRLRRRNREHLVVSRSDHIGARTTFHNRPQTANSRGSAHCSTCKPSKRGSRRRLKPGEPRRSRDPRPRRGPSARFTRRTPGARRPDAADVDSRATKRSSANCCSTVMLTALCLAVGLASAGTLLVARAPRRRRATARATARRRWQRRPSAATGACGATSQRCSPRRASRRSSSPSFSCKCRTRSAARARRRGARARPRQRRASRTRSSACTILLRRTGRAALCRGARRRRSPVPRPGAAPAGHSALGRCWSRRPTAFATRRRTLAAPRRGRRRCAFQPMAVVQELLGTRARAGKGRLHPFSLTRIATGMNCSTRVPADGETKLLKMLTSILVLRGPATLAGPTRRLRGVARRRPAGCLTSFVCPRGRSPAEQQQQQQQQQPARRVARRRADATQGWTRLPGRAWRAFAAQTPESWGARRASSSRGPRS